MAKNNIFFDFEFIEDGYRQLLAPISLGMVKQTGETFYIQFSDAPFNLANEFVKKRVLPKLQAYDMELGPMIDTVWRTRKDARDEIIAFVGNDEPIFIGYYADYDWVLFCQLLGRMVDLPEEWPMYCYDIKQLADEQEDYHDIPRLEQPSAGEHNALADAEWNRVLYTYYTTIAQIFHPKPVSIPEAFATGFPGIFRPNLG